MKPMYFYGILIFPGLIVSCADDRSDMVYPLKDGARKITSVSVFSRDFVTDESPSSRAVENGYVTRFTAGDRIGIFAVSEGQVVDGMDNLCLEAFESQEGLVWKTTDGEPNFDEKCRFFAYYPYSEHLPADVMPAATDHAGFFSAIVDAWIPASDQSTYAAYTASDLMTAQGVIAGSGLQFSMEHQMGLVELRLPGITYRFTNVPAIPDYVIPVAGIAFSEFTPLRVSDVEYRYIVRPRDVGLLSGSFGEDSDFSKWECTFSVNAGIVKTYRIDGDACLLVSHELQPGDFFLSNGRLLPKDTDVSELQEADVIGVVFQVDPSRIGKSDRDALGGEVHALVVSTREATDPYPSFAWYAPGSRDETAIGLEYLLLDDTDPAASFARIDGDTEGYAHTCQILDKRAEDLADYEAFHAIAAFAADVVAPEGTTGWYIPSSGQWLDIIRNLSGLDVEISLPECQYYYGTGWIWLGLGEVASLMDAAMANVSEDDKTGSFNRKYYWSSSVGSDEYAYYFYIANHSTGFNNVSCTLGGKSEIAPYIRYVLAF